MLITVKIFRTLLIMVMLQSIARIGKSSVTVSAPMKFLVRLPFFSNLKKSFNNPFGYVTFRLTFHNSAKKIDRKSEVSSGNACDCHPLIYDDVR
jgi:hypothetical protein